MTRTTTALLLPLLLAAAAGAGDDHGNSTTTDYIRSSCNATLYPDLCYTSLSRYSAAVQQSPRRLARVAIGVALSKVRRTASFLANNASALADYGSDRRAAAALHDCRSNLGDAAEQMRQLGAAGATEEAFRFQMSNVQTWMSAALTDEETCTDGFQDVADGEVKAAVYARAAEAKKYTSNALALVNTYAAAGTP
ncbi:unnamed protein product [Linum tenue]|uniref:Pectinesterase inhibitor domain-containing protein n=1 Tax=Linum tenue TaxID=586396 RepID=A0AAV0JN04_9ROSI|nr:unnamed protein product [Linum tenue]